MPAGMKVSRSGKAILDSYITLNIAVPIASGVFEGLGPDLITHLQVNYIVSTGVGGVGELDLVICIPHPSTMA